MNEQSGDLLDEAVKLFETLRRRMGEAGGRSGDTASDDAGSDDAGTGGDVWSRAVAAEPGEGAGERAAPPRIATGAPECLDCPVCRAIAVARETGPGVRAHVREAGRSLAAAAFDVAAAFDRTGRAWRAGQPGHAGHTGHTGHAQGTGQDEGSARRREEEEA
ncbi:hypothetical protein [Spirillospora sp. NPDC029432]|uniref:hypothetical protein n=1 Tax=Spirillospora sp. NPDC029432 TaxID=3154599 RepID=UPI00345373F1